jgi:hypothetical protein
MTHPRHRPTVSNVPASLIYKALEEFCLEPAHAAKAVYDALGLAPLQVSFKAAGHSHLTAVQEAEYRQYRLDAGAVQIGRELQDSGTIRVNESDRCPYSHDQIVSQTVWVLRAPEVTGNE